MIKTSPRGPVEPLVGRLRDAANEIARHGHAGWGNQMTEAADEIERLAELLREAGAELEWFLDARNNSGSEGPPRVWRLVATIRAALNQTPNT